MRRNRCWLMACFVSIALIGCGTDTEAMTGLGDNATPPDAPCDDAICIDDPAPDAPTSPGAVDPRALSQPHIAVSPDTLMFYGDASSTHSLTEQTITITNKTLGRVWLMRALIIDDTRAGRGRGDGVFFDVDPLNNHPALDPGESYPLVVHFAPDSLQRTAVLRIETTHPQFNALLVTLYGKYFTGW